MCLSEGQLHTYSGPGKESVARTMAKAPKDECPILGTTWRVPKREESEGASETNLEIDTAQITAQASRLSTGGSMVMSRGRFSHGMRGSGPS